MEKLDLHIHNIKNIMDAYIECPFSNGVYAFVGPNGCGKSTIMQSLSLLLSGRHIQGFKRYDSHEDSFIEFSSDDFNEKWKYNSNSKRLEASRNRFYERAFNGMYEGSLFYGTRFNDSRVVDRLLAKKQISTIQLIEADTYVRDTLSHILHGDKNHYQTLKRIRNRQIAESLGLRNLPYFIEPISSCYISQYRMSSGECLLISMLHFIYNAIIRKSLPTNKPILVLIDEIELALHPSAISRLLKLLNDLTEQYDNLIIYLSSHSAEIIRKICPRNMLALDCDTKGCIHVSTPCYPSYAIRDVYSHDGYDYLILVEDILAKLIIERLLDGRCSNKLVHVVPVGGWENVLFLHRDLLNNNVLGIGKEIISALDGDIKASANKGKYSVLKKIFLPIPSVEKYLKNKLLIECDYDFKKILNDRYFRVESIDNVISQYSDKIQGEDTDGKKLFDFLLKNLNKYNISEAQFVQGLCEDVMKSHSDIFVEFGERLKNLIS